MISTVKPSALRQGLPEGSIIIDVRTDLEHGQSHLDCAHVHLPLDEVNADSVTKLCGADKSRPLYLLCKGGIRAAKAAEKLTASGYTNLHVVEGGLDACQQCGIACASTRDGLSLERQVRIAAGSLALAGFLLGVFIHPAWHGLSGLIGGGLIFAGVTGHCGLALVLTKAPWNRV